MVLMTVRKASLLNMVGVNLMVLFYFQATDITRRIFLYKRLLELAENHIRSG